MIWAAFHKDHGGHSVGCSLSSMHLSPFPLQRQHLYQSPALPTGCSFKLLLGHLHLWSLSMGFPGGLVFEILFLFSVHTSVFHLYSHIFKWTSVSRTAFLFPVCASFQRRYLISPTVYSPVKLQKKKPPHAPHWTCIRVSPSQLMETPFIQLLSLKIIGLFMTPLPSQSIFDAQNTFWISAFLTSSTATSLVQNTQLGLLKQCLGFCPPSLTYSILIQHLGKTLPFL